jgi:carbon storage regulator CsrA
MLVLSRRVGEWVFLPTVGAYIKVLSVNGGTVRLSIDAPPEVLIQREVSRDRGDSEVRVDAEPFISYCG